MGAGCAAVVRTQVVVLPCQLHKYFIAEVHRKDNSYIINPMTEGYLRNLKATQILKGRIFKLPYLL